MIGIVVIFWILLGIILYAYIGYGLLIAFFARIKGKRRVCWDTCMDLPEVTLFVTAFNEADNVRGKLRNSLDLNYPPGKLKHVWVTDGSTDGTPDILRNEFPEVQVFHESERRGKIAAMNRGIRFVKSPVVIFSDGNTMLGRDSVMEIVKLFADPEVGCVAGEKRIVSKDSDAAAGAGEGIYWKYESWLKCKESKLNSVVGAAGELFAVRRELFTEVEPDTLLDDFIISLRIAKMGYSIQYSPEAYAVEIASANVKEELKRKIRIAAGGIQSIGRLKELLNPFRYGLLSFQYWSHKIFRWVAVPLALLIVFPLNFIIAMESGIFDPGVYTVLFGLQIVFYAFVLFGKFLENYKIRFKILFVPYYIFIMNLACYLGFFRYIKGKQSVMWERVRRGE